LYLYNKKEEKMSEIKQVLAKREEVLQEMRGLRGMRRGSVMEQRLPVRIKGKAEPELRGPYWLYTRKEKGKSVGRRLNAVEADRYRAEVASFHRFQDLCREYVELSERLGELEEGPAVALVEKKRRRPRWRGTGK
jgi:hypothetical protein